MIYGTKHFRTPLSQGIKIMESLRVWCSGMATPHFVIDLSGGGGKVPITPDYLLNSKGNKKIFRNYCGEEYLYTDLADFDL